MKHAIVPEEGPAGFGACVPHLPGCVAAGESGAEVRTPIAEAIALHLEAMREYGEPQPEPSVRVDDVRVGEAAWRRRLGDGRPGTLLAEPVAGSMDPTSLRTRCSRFSPRAGRVDA